MTDKELAQALFQAGLLTQEQIQAAAMQRTAERSFADVVVQNGWVTAEQLRQVSGGTAGAGPWDTSSSVPLSLPPTASAPPPPYAAPIPEPSVYSPGANGQTPPTFNAVALDSTGMNPHAQVRFDSISIAWGLLRVQMGTWVAATLVVLVTIWIVQAPFTVSWFREIQAAQAAGRQPVPNTGAQILTTLVSTVVSALVMPGLFKMALRQIDGGEITISDLFSGLPYFGNILAAWILYYIALAVGVLACCVGYFVAAVGFSFAFPLIVDKNLGALEAMGRSWNTLKSHILILLVLYFVIGLCAMAGALACGIGIFITYPLLFLAPMVVYREFFPNPNARARNPITPGMGAGGSELRPPIPDPNS